MEYLFIYLLQLGTVVESLAILFAVGLVITIVVAAVCFITEKADDFYNECDWAKTWGKTSLIMLCITTVLCLLPTHQTILLMGGTYYGKKAVKAVVTDEKLKKIDTIINLELDKRIVELKRGEHE